MSHYSIKPASTTVYGSIDAAIEGTINTIREHVADYTDGEIVTLRYLDNGNVRSLLAITNINGGSDVSLSFAGTPSSSDSEGIVFGVDAGEF